MAIYNHRRNDDGLVFPLTGGGQEIGVLAILGTLFGLGVGWVSSNLIYKALDPVPVTPPDARWVWSPDILIGSVIVAFLLTLVSAGLAQRTGDGADVSDLLRHGD